MATGTPGGAQQAASPGSDLLLLLLRSAADLASAVLQAQRQLQAQLDAQAAYVSLLLEQQRHPGTASTSGRRSSRTPRAYGAPAAAAEEDQQAGPAAEAAAEQAGPDSTGAWRTLPAWQFSQPPSRSRSRSPPPGLRLPTVELPDLPDPELLAALQPRRLLTPGAEPDEFDAATHVQTKAATPYHAQQEHEARHEPSPAPAQGQACVPGWGSLPDLGWASTWPQPRCRAAS